MSILESRLIYVGLMAIGWPLNLSVVFIKEILQVIKNVME